MTPDARSARSFDACKGALCAEISATMGFETSNVVFSPAFTDEARAELERLCTGVCAACPVLDAAADMRRRRTVRQTQ